MTQAKFIGKSNQYFTNGKHYEYLSKKLGSVWVIAYDNNNQLTKEHVNNFEFIIK